ncbi:MAG: HEAT repeat domain-containing protein [Planctomycetaceae bacterium]|nr:HEAT repeat domain-containing protein [Planctomycetaceae bacterium]
MIGDAGEALSAGLHRICGVDGMDRVLHRRCWVLALWAGVCCCPGTLLAQQSAVPTDEETASEELPPPPSPLVGNPSTPEDLLEAAFLMAEIARPDLAKLYLDKLDKQDLDTETLLKLRDRFGAAALMRLTRVKELRETATRLLDRSNAAAATRASDPALVLQLLNHLSGDDPEQRAAAKSELKALGALAIPGLLAAYSDPAQVKHHEAVLAALVRVGEPAIPLLLGALQAPDDNFRANIIMVLGRIRSMQAAPYLWHPAVATGESAGVRAAARIALARIFKVSDAGVDRIASEGTVAKLTKIAGEHYRHVSAWIPDSDGKVELWGWSDEQKTVVPKRITPEQASDIVGLVFAKQALALAPELRTAQVLYLSLALTDDIRRNGLDKPLPIGPGTAHDLALSVGAPVVSDVLAQALAASRPATAVAALRVLEQTGTRANLAGNDLKRSPIIAALDYPDPRVQFAAATTILQFDPQGTFRSAPRVVEILTRAAAVGNRPAVVVGEVSIDRGSQIGGFLRELGYEPIVVVSGRDAFKAAAVRGDVELIVLHPNIIRWPLSETLANLRADSRTAGVPIMIHGPPELQNRLQPQVRQYRFVSSATLADTTADFELQLQPFLRQIKYPPMNDVQRANFREAAIGWLAHIAGGRRTKIFDITRAEQVLIDALVDPKLAAPALEALAEIPSQSVQRRMAEVAVERRAPAELREVAALRLAFHIQRFGLLLSTEEIAQLHADWNDAQQPAGVRTALGSVIGSLKPNAPLVGKRLQDFSGE